MKAFIVDRYGSADGVRSSEVPESEMREDDVLIEVHAAGVNPLDSKIRDGEFKLILPYRLPLILGNELAGDAYQHLRRWFGEIQSEPAWLATLPTPSSH